MVLIGCPIKTQPRASKGLTGGYMMQTILETAGVPRFINREQAIQVVLHYRADVKRFITEHRGESVIDLRDVLTYVGAL